MPKVNKIEGFFTNPSKPKDLTKITGKEELLKPKAKPKSYDCNDCSRCAHSLIKVRDYDNDVQAEYDDKGKEKTKEKLAWKLVEKGGQKAIGVHGQGEKRILIVADEVSEGAVLSGKPMVGLEEKLLKKALKEVGIDLERDCWVVNAVQGLGDPKSIGIASKSCRSVLQESITQLKPKVIITLGYRPLAVLLGHKISIKNDFEKFTSYCIPDQEYKCFVIPTTGARDFIWMLNNRLKQAKIWAKESQKEKGYVAKYLQNMIDPAITLLDKEGLKTDDYIVAWKRFISDLNMVDKHILKPFPLDKAKEKIETLFDNVSIFKALDYFAQQKLVAIDIEASSLKFQRPEAEILCVGLATINRAVSFMTREQDVINRLKELITSPTIRWVAHNSNYEYSAFMGAWDVSLSNQAVDSCLLAHCVDNRAGCSGLKFQTAMNEGEYTYGEAAKPFFKVRDADVGTIYEKSNLAINKLPEALERGVLYEQGLLFPLDGDSPEILKENERRDKLHKKGHLLQSEILEYVCLDAWYTMRLLYHLQPRLMDNKEVQAVKFLTEANIALSKMTYNGIQLDMEKLYENIEEVDKEINQYHRQIMESEEVQAWDGGAKYQEQLKTDPEKAKVKPIFNYNSGAQLGRLLFHILKYPGAKQTKTGYATDKATLERVDSPIVKLLLSRKELIKARDVYILGWAREADENGIVKAGFSCNLVSSYRTSSQNPNIQNSIKHNPRMSYLARSFVVPHKGQHLWEFDYASMEARVASIVTQDKTYLEYYSDETGAADIHGHNAEFIFRIDSNNLPTYNVNGIDIAPPEKIWKRLRQITKTFTFSSQYGGGARSIADVIFDALLSLPVDNRPWLEAHLAKAELTSKDAVLQRIKDAEHHMWFELFSDYGNWKISEWKKYVQDGFVRSPTGFVYRGIMNSRTVSNYGIQGSSTHKLLWAIVLATKEFERLNLKSKIIFEIHDSCGVSVQPGEEYIVEKIMSEAMIAGTKDHPLFQWANELEFAVDCDKYEGSWASKAHDVRMDLNNYDKDYITA